MNEGFDLSRSGATARQYILGRRQERSEWGVLKVGRYLAIDGSSGSDVYIDCLGPHAVLICRKRGYGKSYTMGTMIEELALQAPPVSDNLATIVIDSLGIFWTLAKANIKEESELLHWNLKPKGFDVKIFVPLGSVAAYTGMGINAAGIAIPVNHLSGTDWCTLFQVSPVHPVGVLITRLIQDLMEEAFIFSLEDVLDRIHSDTLADTDTKLAALNYLSAARRWDVFEKEGLDIADLVRPGKTSVIDLSSLPDAALQSVVLKIIARRIYQERILARRQYEINRMADSNNTTMPMVWMFVDEAHSFLPGDGDSPARDVLVNEWLKQGRQPGLSLVLATQRPSALHPDVLRDCQKITYQILIAIVFCIIPWFNKIIPFWM